MPEPALKIWVQALINMGSIIDPAFLMSEPALKIPEPVLKNARTCISNNV